MKKTWKNSKLSKSKLKFGLKKLQRKKLKSIFKLTK